MGKKNKQAIHKALLGRPLGLGILSSQKFLQEIPFHSQAQISNLLSYAKGKPKILPRCSDMNNGNPCHTSSSTEQRFALFQQIEKSLSMNPSQYIGGDTWYHGMF